MKNYIAAAERRVRSRVQSTMKPRLNAMRDYFLIAALTIALIYGMNGVGFV